MFENDELITNCELTGDDLCLELVAPNVLACANATMAVHVLLVDAESAFVVEKVELDLYEDVALINDHSCARWDYFQSLKQSFIWLTICFSRYFIHSKHAVLCISLNWLDQIESGSELTSQSVVETLLTAPHVSIGGVTLAHGRIPNSLTQDGPCLVCSLSSGSGALIPLLTLPATLLQPRGKSSTTKKCATPVVANKLADLLNAKPERLSLAGCDKTGSIGSGSTFWMQNDNIFVCSCSN